MCLGWSWVLKITHPEDIYQKSIPTWPNVVFAIENPASGWADTAPALTELLVSRGGRPAARVTLQTLRSATKTRPSREPDVESQRRLCKEAGFKLICLRQKGMFLSVGLYLCRPLLKAPEVTFCLSREQLAVCIFTLAPHIN